MKKIYFIHGGAFGMLVYAGFYTDKSKALKELRRLKSGSLKHVKGCKVVTIIKAA